MWLLECDDPEALGGKRIWIRPGSRCVLGRVKSVNVNVVIGSSAAKSISRTHLIINVSKVNEGDGVRLHSRSEVTLQDSNTKHGTIVNGTALKGTSSFLTGDHFTIQLGKYEHVFRLKWDPVILSFSLSTKDKRDTNTMKNAMLPYGKLVEAFDVKTIPTWVGATTHVVATKRNTAMGLQALVNGRFIVTHAYLDAIVVAATPRPAPAEGQLGQSPLEADFDANWPNPLDFLPRKSNEPVDLPPEKFVPDPRRSTLFQGWTFIFCDQLQYSTLLAPITDAHGKAELFKLEAKRTIAPDILDFVKKRGHGSQVAVVLFKHTGAPEWADDLARDVEALWGYQLVNQSSFLEIIVTQDTSKLRVPAEVDSSRNKNYRTQAGIAVDEGEPDLPSSIPETQRDTVAIKTKEASSDMAAPAPPRRRTRRRGAAAAVAEFSFDIGGEFLPAPTPDPETQLFIGDTEASAMNTTSGFTQTLPTAMEVDELSAPQATQHNTQYPPTISQLVTRTRGVKRAAPDQPERNREDEDLDVMDLLPGSKFVKKRKLVEGEERVQEVEHIPSDPPVVEDSEPEPESVPARGRGKTAAAKAKKNKHFVSKAREIRNQESLAAEKAQEEEKAMMEGLEIEKMKNLAIVETVEVRPRPNRLSRSAQSGGGGSQWNPEWEGRKNFKKFRRAGRVSSSTSSKVFIELVEVKSRDYGLGDDYWVDDDVAATHSVAHRRRQKTQPQDEDAHSHYTTAHERTPAPDSQPPTVSRAAPKRVTATSQLRTSTAKRQKRMQITEHQESDEDEDDDDSDDELKFRFRRRR